MISERHPEGEAEGRLDEFERIRREILAAVSEYSAELEASGVRPNFTLAEARAAFVCEGFDDNDEDGLSLACWRERIAPRLSAIEGLREFFSRQISRAERLHYLVREHPDFDVINEPTLFLYYFRYLPNSLTDHQDEPQTRILLDRLNQEIADAVRRDGLNYVLTTRVGGRVAMRLSYSSHGMTDEETDAAFETLARWGWLLKSPLVCKQKPTEMEALQCSSEYFSSPTEL